jgi:hypothetical protein
LNAASSASIFRACRVATACLVSAMSRQFSSRVGSGRLALRQRRVLIGILRRWRWRLRQTPHPLTIAASIPRCRARGFIAAVGHRFHAWTVAVRADGLNWQDEPLRMLA